MSAPFSFLPILFLLFFMTAICCRDTENPAGPEAVTLDPGEAVRILVPNGGETLRVGDTVVITWLIDTSLVQNPLFIDVSTDNGRTYLPLIIDLNNAPKAGDTTFYDKGNRGVYQCSIPDSLWNSDFTLQESLVSDSCLIQISEAYASTDEYVRFDCSDNVFSIIRNPGWGVSIWRK